MFRVLYRSSSEYEYLVPTGEDISGRIVGETSMVDVIT